MVKYLGVKWFETRSVLRLRRQSVTAIIMKGAGLSLCSPTLTALRTDKI